MKDTSVRGWKNAYCKELLSQSSRKRGPVEIVELPQKRRGRPLLLGDELEQEVKMVPFSVNTETVMGTARGVVISHDANLQLVRVKVMLVIVGTHEHMLTPPL